MICCYGCPLSPLLVSVLSCPLCHSVFTGPPRIHSSFLSGMRLYPCNALPSGHVVLQSVLRLRWLLVHFSLLSAASANAFHVVFDVPYAHALLSSVPATWACSHCVYLLVTCEQSRTRPYATLSDCDLQGLQSRACSHAATLCYKHGSWCVFSHRNRQLNILLSIFAVVSVALVSCLAYLIYCY